MATEATGQIQVPRKFSQGPKSHLLEKSPPRKTMSLSLFSGRRRPSFSPNSKLHNLQPQLWESERLLSVFAVSSWWPLPRSTLWLIEFSVTQLLPFPSAFVERFVRRGSGGGVFPVTPRQLEL